MDKLLDIQTRCYKAINKEKDTIYLEALDIELESTCGKLSQFLDIWMTPKRGDMLSIKELLKPVMFKQSLIKEVIGTIKDMHEIDVAWFVFTSHDHKDILKKIKDDIKDDVLKEVPFQTFFIRNSVWVCIKDYKKHLDDLIGLATDDRMLSIYTLNDVKTYVYGTLIHEKKSLDIDDYIICADVHGYPFRTFFMSNILYHMSENDAAIWLKHSNSFFIYSMIESIEDRKDYVPNEVKNPAHIAKSLEKLLALYKVEDLISIDFIYALKHLLKDEHLGGKRHVYRK